MSWHRGMHAADHGVGVEHGRSEPLFISSLLLDFASSTRGSDPTAAPSLDWVNNNVELVANWVAGGRWC